MNRTRSVSKALSTTCHSHKRKNNLPAYVPAVVWVAAVWYAVSYPVPALWAVYVAAVAAVGVTAYPVWPVWYAAAPAVLKFTQHFHFQELCSWPTSQLSHFKQLKRQFRVFQAKKEAADPKDHTCPTAPNWGYWWRKIYVLKMHL